MTSLLPPPPSLSEAVRVPLPTPYGVFEIRAFEQPSGHVYVAMVLGDIGDGDDVLVRLHSECLTGDALGSLRCDCGVQLKLALRTIAATGRGVLVYATDHEGRGIGLVNKLRAYVAQDGGADTVDANTALGLPIDARDYGASAEVLDAIGVRTIRLLTNNPRKAAGLGEAGATIASVEPLPTAPHHRNLGYLTAKTERMGHVQPTGSPATLLGSGVSADATALLGPVRPHAERPFVAVKVAQSVDGRIATSTGDSQWISGEPERTVSHALRAACDAVLVGIETVLRDQPRLTVRMTPGASPTRVVLDTGLRMPLSARVLDHDAATTIITTDRSDPDRRDALRDLGARVLVVPADGDGRIDLRAAFAALRSTGTESVLVEGGGRVITALLSAGLVDRLVVAVAPLVLGAGTDAVGPLGVTRVADGIRLVNRSIVPVGDDVVLAWDVAPRD